eukprot:TRINITY_DN18563_c0_g1_i1.p1 TRINITY_DN18563_c0_g1~~TRINITY_DN18563_c0_g1_i1.p1  ORF type:complete len:108 (+),score=6.67 TRINITY_DN18563_c0_g1_i1:559-882(+)
MQLLISQPLPLSWGSECQNNYFVNCGHFPRRSCTCPRSLRKVFFWSVLETNIHMKGTEMELLLVHGRPEDYPVYPPVSAEQSQYKGCSAQHSIVYFRGCFWPHLGTS